MPDWSKVRIEHVNEACRQFDAGNVAAIRPARNTFLLHNGNIYPAKFIRGLAYRIATGVELDPSRDYAGGDETSKFFAGLGLKTSRPASSPGNGNPSPSTALATPPPKPVAVRRFEPQKQALYDLLVRRFGAVETETKFPWLVVPHAHEMDAEISAIHQALSSMRGHDSFATGGFPLSCDFFVRKENLLVEYDERQHFTEQRAKSLGLYPSRVTTAFSIAEWIAACESIRASDSDPAHRDEQRAFYDTLRDMLAARNGVRLIRIRTGVVDWTMPGSDEALDALLNATMSASAPAIASKQASAATDRSEIKRIGLVSHDYNIADRHGRFDYSEHFARINAACDERGCDTILYALFTWDSRSTIGRSHDAIFDQLANVQRVIIEVGRPPYSADHVEAWVKGEQEPRLVRQAFAQSIASDADKRQFMDDLPARCFDSALMVLCGEANIVRLRRSKGTWDDSFHFLDRMNELGIRVVLNPIHDYMTRYEMREKRRLYSTNGRTVVSVWNQGKGKEARDPWNAFVDGQELTHLVRCLPAPCPERPDIRVGIFDMPQCST